MLRIRRVFIASFIAGAVALAGTTMLLQASNIPFITGPQDPSQLQATINTLIRSINQNVGGLLNANTGAVATGAGTAEQVLQTYTMPANTLTTAGQSVRITCWGTTAANTNVKTRKLYFGTSVITTAAEAANAVGWRLELIVMRTGAATQTVVGKGLAGTTGVTPLATYNNLGTDNLAAGVVIKCAGTDGTDAAGDITANGMIVELLK